MKKLMLVLLAAFLVYSQSGKGIALIKEPDNRGPYNHFEDSIDLKIILKKAADYCAKLKNIALFFICDEEVFERIYEPYRILEWSGRWRTEENSYLYDYQLVRKESINESRTLLMENKRVRKESNASLKTKRVWYKHIIFGPVGIFSADTQALHSYTLEKEERLWGRPVIVVNVVPANKAEVDWLYGKAWLDVADGGVLRIEWAEESMKNYAVVQEFAKKMNAKPLLDHSSEYRYEKNGIRFPSLFEIREEYEQLRPVLLGKRKLLKSELKVIYKNYKFFVVDTEVKVIK
jgi:hypothetical protein